MHFEEQVASADAIAHEYLLPHFAAQGMDRVSIDDLSSEELDSLPFGAIQLNPAGIILKYNDYESKLARVTQKEAIGKNFFTDIAPCTNVQEFYGRFRQGTMQKKLFQKFRFHFAFKHAPRDVTVTLFYSDIADSIWVFIRPV